MVCRSLLSRLFHSRTYCWYFFDYEGFFHLFFFNVDVFLCFVWVISHELIHCPLVRYEMTEIVSK
jgi:hypothetical protein